MIKRFSNKFRDNKSNDFYLSALILSFKIGLFVYVIDLNYYYVFRLGYDYFMLELMVLNLLSLFFLFFKVRKLALSQRNRVLLIATLLVVGLGAYIKLYTQGDPIFDWFRVKININNALLLFSILSVMILFENSIIQEVIQFSGFSKSHNDEFLSHDLLDDDMFDDSEQKNGS